MSTTDLNTPPVALGEVNLLAADHGLVRLRVDNRVVRIWVGSRDKAELELIRTRESASQVHLASLLALFESAITAALRLDLLR